MRVVPDGDGLEWRRRRDEQARRQVTELVPRPGCPIYGLAAPPVRPVTLDGAEQVNGDWTQITLGYGPRDASTGPYLRVTTAVTEAEIISASLNSPGGMQITSTTGMHGIDPEAELRHALQEEAARTAALPAEQATTPSEPAVTREQLPAGDALIVRQGTVWAARLVPDDAGGVPAAITVTIVGRDVAPDDVRLETLPDLREAIEGRTAEIARIIAERRRQPPVPPPELEPAEGVAALRALADFISAGRPDRPSAARSDGAPRHPPGWGPMYGALWQRAVLEQQRVAGMDAQAADAVVTSAINHLGHLAEHAPWFSGDERLRAAAVDETLRHAMLGDAVRSEPAQRAWSAYWSRPRPRDPDDMWARHESQLALEFSWLAAWEAWTRNA